MSTSDVGVRPPDRARPAPRCSLGQGTNLLMPIIPSDTAKHTAPSAVHAVGNPRKQRRAHPSRQAPRCRALPGTGHPLGEQAGARTTSAEARQGGGPPATVIAAPASRGPGRETSGIRGGEGSTGLRDEEGAETQHVRTVCHHGHREQEVPPLAENTSAKMSHRRSRAIGCVSAAPASSTAVSALTAGCSANWPVSSAPRRQPAAP